MEWKVELSTKSKKYLKKLKDNKLKLVLLDKLEELKTNPDIGIPLKGSLKQYRKIVISYKKAKNYRIVYEVVDQEITIYIIDVGTRESILYA
jgi:addiction module RelE/StbE family toxin